jgi:hypothetical protein
VDKTYIEFVCEELNKEQLGAPIYSKQIAKKIENVFNLEPKAAAAATAVAFKRILDGKAMPDLRTYQKGIYYRTAATAFGEMGINKEQLMPISTFFRISDMKPAQLSCTVWD